MKESSAVGPTPWRIFVPVGLGVLFLLSLGLMVAIRQMNRTPPCSSDALNAQPKTFAPPISAPMLIERETPPTRDVQRSKAASAAESGRQLETILSGLRLAREALRQSDHGAEFLSRFDSQRYHRLDQLTLWARSYPAEALEFARQIAEDSARIEDDQFVASFMLGVLAQEGLSIAENILAKAVKENREPLARFATEALAAADPQGKWRTLYWERARLGDSSAIEALSLRPETENIRVLETIKILFAGQPEPAFSIHHDATVALKKQAMLQSETWSATITSILSTPAHLNGDWTEWAIAAAGLRQLPGFKEILRARLDQGEQEYFAKTRVNDLPNRLVGARNADLDFAQSFEIARIDRYFDQILIALWKNGGTLSDIEEQRLALLGYSAFPRDTLTKSLRTPR